MKALKITAVRSSDGKYHAIEIQGEGPNPSSETPPMIGQTITLALLRGNGAKERGQAWAKTAKALRKVLVEAENHAADLGGLKPLSMYVLTVDGEQGSWWVAARSMGEAFDLSGLELVQPFAPVHCREAHSNEKATLTGPREVVGQDPIELMQLDANRRSRMIGWTWAEDDSNDKTEPTTTIGLPPGCTFHKTNGGSVYVLGLGDRRVTPLCCNEEHAAEFAWNAYRAFHEKPKDTMP